MGMIGWLMHIEIKMERFNIENFTLFWKEMRKDESNFVPGD